MTVFPKTAILAAALIAGFSTFPKAQAQDGKLAGSDLKQAISGSTVSLSVGLGVVLPISYSPNGTMAGSVSALGQHQSDQGRWWVSGNQLCQKWSNWLDGRQYCFTMRRTGNTVHWHRNDGKRGVASISG